MNSNSVIVRYATLTFCGACIGALMFLAGYLLLSLIVWDWLGVNWQIFRIFIISGAIAILMSFFSRDL